MAKIKKRFYRRKQLKGKRIHKRSWLQRTSKNYKNNWSGSDEKVLQRLMEEYKEIAAMKDKDEPSPDYRTVRLKELDKAIEQMVKTKPKSYSMGYFENPKEGWRKIKNTKTDIIYEEVNPTKEEGQSKFLAEAHKVGGKWSITIPPFKGEERYLEVESKDDANYLLRKFMKQHPNI